MNNLIIEYLKRGFGSMNKNDFEAGIFHEILNDAARKGKPNYEQSITLKILESDVKKPNYEAASSLTDLGILLKFNTLNKILTN